MRIDTSNDFGNHVVYDIDADNIPMCVKWADDEAVEYCQMKHSYVDGDLKFFYDDEGKAVEEIKKSDISNIDMRLRKNSEICERFNVGVHLEKIRAEDLS